MNLKKILQEQETNINQIARDYLNSKQGKDLLTKFTISHIKNLLEDADFEYLLSKVSRDKFYNALEIAIMKRFKV